MQTIAYLEQLTAAGLIGFWLLFFTIGLAPDQPPPGYFAFEHAFPAPDCLLAVVLFLSGRLLLRTNPVLLHHGRSLGMVAAGALLFLGGLDISFNVQNGMYGLSVLDTLMTLAINLWCLGFGSVLAISCGQTGPTGRT